MNSALKVLKATSPWAAFVICVLLASACQATLIAFDSFATTAGGADYDVGPIQAQNPTVGLSGFTGAWTDGSSVFQAANGGLTHDLMPGTALDGQLIGADWWSRNCRRFSRDIGYTPTNGTYYMSVLLQKSEETTKRDLWVGLAPLEPFDTCSSESGATYIGILDGGIGFLPLPASSTQMLTSAKMAVGETYFALLQLDYSTSSSHAVTATIFDGSSAQVANQTFPGLSLDGDIGRFGLGTFHFSPTVIADEWRFGTELSDVMITGPACDFNGDDLCDITDINSLLAVGPVAPGVPAAGMDEFDLTGDGVINNADVAEWLALAATENSLGSPYKLGDAGLDGIVDGQDFLDWNAAKFTPSLLWSDGNFNGDAVVDGQDFLEWNANKFTSSDVVTAVPEPGICLLTVLAVAYVTAARVLKRRGNSGAC